MIGPGYACILRLPLNHYETSIRLAIGLGPGAMLNPSVTITFTM